MKGSRARQALSVPSVSTTVKFHMQFGAVLSLFFALITFATPPCWRRCSLRSPYPTRFHWPRNLGKSRQRVRLAGLDFESLSRAFSERNARLFGPCLLTRCTRLVVFGVLVHRPDIKLARSRKNVLRRQHRCHHRIDSGNRIFVADAGNNRVESFQWGVRHQTKLPHPQIGKAIRIDHPF